MKNINLDKIVLVSISKYKILIVAYIGVVIAFILGQIIFPKNCSKFIDNLPKDKMSILKLIGIAIIPYVIAEIMNHISSIIIAKYYSFFEINMINSVLQETLEILKNNPKKNLDKIILSRNIVKILEIKYIMKLFTSKILPPLILSFGLFFYFMFIDKKLAFIVLGISIISLILIIKSGNSNINGSTIRDEKFNEYIAELGDIIENTDTILHDNMVNFEILRLNDKKKNMVKYSIINNVETVKFKIIISIIALMIIFLVGGLILNNYINNKITKGETIMYLYLILSLVLYYGYLSENINDFLYFVGNYKNAKDYFKTFDKKEENNNKINISEGKIELRDIILFLGDKKIYDKYSITIQPNTITGITGAIGKGKTSLLKLILGYYEYDGQILIDGQNIKKYDKTELRRYISYIPQNPKFFNRTILENILYGSNYTEKQLIELINSLNLEEFINKFPNRLNTLIIENGINLSGGQKQIIYLLKTMVLNRKIILMDEPTSNLDTYYTELIKKLTKELKNKTIIIVSHDKTLKDIFENNIVIE